MCCARGSLRINLSKFVRIEMAKSTKGTTKSKAKGKPESFIWTDDEVELLLKVTEEYKVKQTAENVDWESCQSKYSDILELFISQYPSAENAESIGKDFPHKNEEMTKVIITTKLKAIRSKFRAAVDSGRKSGHGRVVLLYFESCEAIWGGSPATSTIRAGIESTDITIEVESRSSSPTPSLASTPSSTSFESERLGDIDNPEPGASQEMQLQESTVNKRRNLLDGKLRGHKQEKLKRKLSTDSQLLTIAQEEMQMKRRLLDKMDCMDKEHSQQMARLNTSMEQLTGSIADGFAMLREMMQSSALPAQYTQQHNVPFTPPRHNALPAQYTPPGPNYPDGYNLTPLQPRHTEQASMYPSYS